MATNSAFIYALDYVDRSMGVNIIDVYYSYYFMTKAGVPIDGN